MIHKTAANATISDKDSIAVAPSLYPISDAETSSGLTAADLTVVHPHGDVRRYGAVLDGSTDDSAALTAAIGQQQAGGVDVLGVPGTTLYVSAWVALSLTAAFRLRGNGMTLKCGNTTRVAFVTCKANFSIEDCIFDGWYRVISNTTAVTEAITEGRFLRNYCKNATEGATNNAYYLLIQNPVSNLWIDDNRFDDAKVTCIYIGDNTYANQDTWDSIHINRNTIDGVTCPNGIGSSYAILVYGRNVEITGNEIKDVEGYTVSLNASNGAFGIYTKARFSRIIGNAVRNIGLTTNTVTDGQIVGINVKGSERVVTTSPQGYSSIAALNHVTDVGVAETSGYAISSDHSGIMVVFNQVEGIGRKGVVIADSSDSTTDANLVAFNQIRGNLVAFDGIDAATRSSRTNINGNDIYGYVGIRVRSVSGVCMNVNLDGNSTSGTVGVYLTAATHNVSNIRISDHLLTAGDYGIYFSTSGGGVISDVMSTDCDFSAAGTLALGDSLPATLRVRNCRGYVNENGGVTAAIATGATVTHGMTATPTIVSVTALDSGPTDVYVASIGATTFTINYGGGGTHVFAWEAKTGTHYA